MPNALPQARIAAAASMFVGGLERSDRNNGEHGNRRLPTPLLERPCAQRYFGAVLVWGAAALPVVDGAFTLRDDCILRGPAPVTGV